MQAINNFAGWYLYTSRIIGVPVLFIVIIVLSQKVVLTGTCYSVGYQCDSAIGSDQGLADYMGSMLDANPNVDIITKPRGKR